jgi:flagellar motor protein MotB
VRSIVDVLSTVRRAVHITGHVDKTPSAAGAMPKMDLSLGRADAVYQAMVSSGYSSRMCRKITGNADFVPSMDNPSHVGNNRVVILLPYAPEDH